MTSFQVADKKNGQLSDCAEKFKLAIIKAFFVAVYVMKTSNNDECMKICIEGGRPVIMQL